MSNKMKKTAFKSCHGFANYFFLLVQAHVGTPAGKCRAGGAGGVPSIWGTGMSICTKPARGCRDESG